MTRLRRRTEAPPSAEAAATPETRGAAAPGGDVQLIWGIVAERLALAELRVEDARRLLEVPYGIPANAPPVVNGRAAEPDQRLVAGDVLEFTRPIGEKGGCA